MTRIPFTLLAWMFLFAGVTAAAPASIDDVRLGLGDRYKVGHWFPIRFSLQAGGQPLQGDVEITAVDGDGVRSTFRGGELANISLPANGNTTVLSYIRIGRTRSQVEVQFRPQRGRVIANTINTGQLPPAILASEKQAVLIGGRIETSTALAFLSRDENERTVISNIDAAADLPDRWYGYDGVDTLVLVTGKPQFYAQATPAQLGAIDQWVKLGGRLVLSVGKNGEQMLGAEGPLGRFAPGRLARVIEVQSTAGVEDFAESPRRVDSGDDGNRTPLLLSVLRELRGEVLVYEGSDAAQQPLVVRAPHGLGQVVFLATDLDLPPLADWKGRDRLLARLLHVSFGEGGIQTQDATGKVAHLGYHDLAGQLRSALDRFAGVHLVPFSLVAAMIVVYIALIGPVDYLLVRRLLGRMELTWITFPLIVAGFCVLAWYVSTWARGRVMRANQIDVVDVDVQQSLVRGTSWIGLYSPHSGQFDLDLQLQNARQIVEGDAGMLLAWQGLPGDALGGMNNSTALDVASRGYTIDTVHSDPRRTELVGLPASASSTRALSARWWGTSNLQADHDLRYSSLKLLHGHVANPLPFPLTKCELYHDRWVYQLGTLQPGQRVELGDLTQPLDTRWVLTQRKVREAREMTTPWDRGQIDDVPRIMQMVMFHEAAGGRGYTNLLHRYQNFADLSGQLALDRAILVGRSDNPASRLMRNGQPVATKSDKHWTYYRIVLPTRAEATDSE